MAALLTTVRKTGLNLGNIGETLSGSHSIPKRTGISSGIDDQRPIPTSFNPFSTNCTAMAVSTLTGPGSIWGPAKSEANHQIARNSASEINRTIV